jgi:hypothetical protein
MLGRGGRGRQTIPGRLDGTKEEAGPESDVGAWFRKQVAGAPPTPATPPPNVNAAVPKGYETVVCKPAGYWSLSVLPSLDSVLVRRNWISQPYSGSGTVDIIPPNWQVSNGRVYIVTGYCFQGIAAGVGGTSSTAGVPCYLPDTSGASFELQFRVAGGPIETSQTGTASSGGKGGSNEQGGSAEFNYGYDKDECPVEIFIPPNQTVRATYRELSTPYVTPIAIVFRMQGYEVPQDKFFACVSGARR